MTTMTSNFLCHNQNSLDSPYYHSLTPFFTCQVILIDADQILNWNCLLLLLLFESLLFAILMNLKIRQLGVRLTYTRIYNTQPSLDFEAQFFCNYSLSGTFIQHYILYLW